MKISNNTIFITIIIIIILSVLLDYTIYKFNNILVDTYDINKLLDKNKNYPNTKDKQNVVFFMSSNYSQLPRYAKLSKTMLESYCKYHGYKFHYIQHPSDSISPYWLRVSDFINLTNIYPQNTHIIYFDLDVAITPDMFKIPITQLTNNIDYISGNNWNMYVSVDRFNFTSINTGVICIKNTPWIKEFLNKWISMYPSQKWQFDNKSGKWHCNENILLSCSWAGQSYEQGSLKLLYQKNTLNCKDKILPVNTNIFGDTNNLNKNKNTTEIIPFTLHLMDKPDSTRETIFSNFYKILLSNSLL